jgi:ketosteroid isomerase-like protein
LDSLDTELIAANAAFYDAFNRRDVAGMEALWASGPSIACVHPGWRAQLGRDEVMKSWRAILANPDAPKVRWSEETVHLHGDAAFVICLEELGGDTLVATNFFVREGASWKLVHHHAGPTRRRSSRAPSRPAPGDLN